jgi:DNA processing protein
VEEKYAPKQVYVAGKLQLPLSSPRVAIIGSRKATTEGLDSASIIAKYLVQNDVTIVSGLAEGIDTAAHTSAIDAKGRTVAVLGTPLNKVYPQKNAKLQGLIMQEHLAISQFPPWQPVTPKNFVIRNRTMALISDASVIVEASNSSGSLHQGWEALRLRRPLFILSRLMQDTTLSWPKDLVKHGAKEFWEPKDILEELPVSQQKILEVLQ